MRKETKNKKRIEDKNNLNQMENGTRKTCVRKIKTRGKRKTRQKNQKR